MNFWILKSEPETYSWSDMRKQGVTNWEGVRNYQAQNYMKTMKVGDLCFFYHSGKERSIVGVVEVCEEFQPDPTDETARFGMVKVRHKYALKVPVSLAYIKQHHDLNTMALVKQSRLSVCPITKEQFEVITTCEYNVA